jgi:hypothetical protein
MTPAPHLPAFAPPTAIQPPPDEPTLVVIGVSFGVAGAISAAPFAMFALASVNLQFNNGVMDHIGHTWIEWLERDFWVGTAVTAGIAGATAAAIAALSSKIPLWPFTRPFGALHGAFVGVIAPPLFGASVHTVGAIGLSPSEMLVGAFTGAFYAVLFTLWLTTPVGAILGAAIAFQHRRRVRRANGPHRT